MTPTPIDDSQRVVPVERHDQEKARTIVRRAVDAGILIRPSTCSRCMDAPGTGSDGRSLIHAHHHDYQKPLSIEWLCARCHRKETPLPAIMGAPCLGEKNGASKLTSWDVVAMRNVRSETNMPYTAIGRMWNVDKKTAERACKGIHWGHVEMEKSSEH